MNFLRKTKGCTKLDHITNEMIRTELNIYPVNDTIEQYRNSWLQHVKNARHKNTERALQYKKRKTKEKMARYSVKMEQANA
jgi:hypothetical protein